jgi:tetratricopeptide (TPR) repeat protein
MLMRRFGFVRHTAIAALAALVLAPNAAFAQPVALSGTYTLVPEQSTATPGPVRYKSMSITFDAQGKMTVDGVDAQGKPIKGTVTAVADGKAYPAAGVAEFDTTTYTRFSDTTASYNYQKRKTTVALGNRVISREGYVVTFREQVFNANGRPVGTTTLVFEKPGAPPIQQASAPAGGTTMVTPGLTADETVGTAALEKDDNDAAIVAFTKVINAKDPKANPFYDFVGRGIAYAKKNMNNEALADFDSAIKIKSDDADARFRRAGVKLQMKEYKGAIEDFTEVVRIDDKNATAYRLRGFAHNTLGDDKSAAGDYEKACALNKEYCN